MNTNLAGKRVLVVEDEPIIGMLIEDMLVECGAVVVGPATHLDQALRFASDEPLDAAILDVNLDGQRSYAVADVLKGRGIPYLFATGYGDGQLAREYGGAEVIEKPFRLETVAAAISRLV